jgi:periplasmic divalent cation tolerance protein
MKKAKGNYVVVFVTTSSKTEARRIARGVLSQRLAACVNILSGVESHYWWQGKLERSKECLLVMKTKRSAVPRLTNAVRKLHSYDVPEIIVLRVQAGSKEYLKWISESVR